ncbi:MAG: gwe2 protein [candidate division WWE3 bacterium CSP1-7]|uniref:Gwe2 protein n=1 Tax=candidate division WWE3 bacterium CSP1-7 TaxID=1576480 RepID=A0A0T5ZXJ6_UNCKA|nr:MAG: gwe2 protein [candidate division WWE3 bacterium CSP1-7]
MQKIRARSHKSRASAKGSFTLIELLIYMALVSIFLTAAVTSMWDIILGSTKSSVEQEVQESLRYVSHRLGFEIRNANSMGASSDFGVNLAVTPAAILSLNSPNPNNPTEFRVAAGLLQIKQGGGDWTTISSSALEVTDLVFTDLTDGSSENIEFTVTVKYRNPGSRSELEKEATFEGAGQLR